MAKLLNSPEIRKDNHKTAIPLYKMEEAKNYTKRAIGEGANNGEVQNTQSLYIKQQPDRTFENTEAKFEITKSKPNTD